MQLYQICNHSSEERWLNRKKFLSVTDLIAVFCIMSWECFCHSAGKEWLQMLCRQWLFKRSLEARQINGGAAAGLLDMSFHPNHITWARTPRSNAPATRQHWLPCHFCSWSWLWNVCFSSASIQEQLLVWSSFWPRDPLKQVDHTPASKDVCHLYLFILSYKLSCRDHSTQFRPKLHKLKSSKAGKCKSSKLKTSKSRIHQATNN